ncbi:hypothetical protein BSP4_43410 [Bacillus subtilis subsp. subtilis]|nr:hypothetical protein BSP4_43410 [Bacillus subtilis subsp. subtilis]
MQYFLIGTVVGVGACYAIEKIQRSYWSVGR